MFHVFSLYRFNTFSLEASSSCRYDYVAVYDGPDSLAPLMGRFCGTVIPPDIRSSTNNLFIIFSTDATVSGVGWRATYSQTLGKLTFGLFMMMWMCLYKINGLTRRIKSTMTRTTNYCSQWFAGM